MRIFTTILIFIFLLKGASFAGYKPLPALSPKLLWSITARPGLLGVPLAVDLGRGRVGIVATNSLGEVLLISGRSGRLLKKFEVRDAILALPWVGYGAKGIGPFLVVATKRGTVACFDLKSGANLWVQKVSGGVVFPLYVADWDGSGDYAALVLDTRGRAHFIDLLRGSFTATVRLDAPATAPPLVADLDGDGFPEAVVATSTGSLYILKGFSARKIHRFEDQIQAKPAAVDINADGEEEIIVVTENGKIYVLSPNGSVFREDDLQVKVYGSPAVFDLDLDGKPEIIVPCAKGGLIFTNSERKMLEVPFGGRVVGGVTVVRARRGMWGVAFSSIDGRLCGIDAYGNWLFRVWLPYGSEGPPVVGDVNGDGYEDIVVVDGTRVRAYTFKIRCPRIMDKCWDFNSAPWFGLRAEKLLKDLKAAGESENPKEWVDTIVAGWWQWTAGEKTEIAPVAAKVLADFISSLVDMGSLEAAKVWVDYASKILPSSEELISVEVKVLTALAEREMAKGNYLKAAEIYRQAFEVTGNPTYPRWEGQAYYLHGRKLLLNGKDLEARAFLRRATLLWPEVRGEIANLYVELAKQRYPEDPVGAIAFLKGAWEFLGGQDIIRKEIGARYFELGKKRLYEGKVDAAITYFKEALGYDPTLSAWVIKTSLIYSKVYTKRKEWEKAYIIAKFLALATGKIQYILAVWFARWMFVLAIAAIGSVAAIFGIRRALRWLAETQARKKEEVPEILPVEASSFEEFAKAQGFAIGEGEETKEETEV